MMSPALAEKYPQGVTGEILAEEACNSLLVEVCQDARLDPQSFLHLIAEALKREEASKEITQYYAWQLLGWIHTEDGLVLTSVGPEMGDVRSIDPIIATVYEQGFTEHFAAKVAGLASHDTPSLRELAGRTTALIFRENS